MSNPDIPTPGRPQMPAGYGLDAEGAQFRPIEWSWATDQLERARNYWVATTRGDSRPHVAPVWGLWLDGRFQFATDAESVKAKNVERNPSSTVHLESGDDVVILEGWIEQVTDKAALSRFVEEYDRKYAVRPEISPDSAPVFSLRHTSVLAWQESDFPNTATRWKFR